MAANFLISAIFTAPLTNGSFIGIEPCSTLKSPSSGAEPTLSFRLSAYICISSAFIAANPSKMCGLNVEPPYFSFIYADLSKFFPVVPNALVSRLLFGGTEVSIYAFSSFIGSSFCVVASLIVGAKFSTHSLIRLGSAGAAITCCSTG